MLEVEIRVKGKLEKADLDWFDGLSVGHTEKDFCILSGHVRDQAMLRSLLTRPSNLGFDLNSINTQPGKRRRLNYTIVIHNRWS